MKLRIIACALALAALQVSPARSHTEPYSWVDVRFGPEKWGGQVTAHVVDLAHEIGIATPDSLRRRSFVRQRTAELESAVARLFLLEADGVRIVPRWTGHTVLPDRAAVAFQFEVESTTIPRHLRLTGPLFAYDPTHETYFNVYDGEVVRHQDLLDHRHSESRYATGFGQRRIDVIRRFVFEGVHHIFIGPDHILFIVGLILLGGRVGQLLEIITAFTLAHSVTLALAATGLVTPPTRLVESVIALSIVYVGADNLFAAKRRRDRRALIAALFGLVHGFGFASVLRELGLPRGALAWSLFSFNVGVELGQACIVLAVAPFLAWLRAHRPQAALRTVTVGSLLVIAAGTYWFVQRAILS